MICKCSRVIAATLMISCGGGVSADPLAQNDSLRCAPAAPFSTPALVPIANSLRHQGRAKLSADELTIFFTAQVSSENPEDWDLFTATRTTIHDSFGLPRPIAGLNGSTADTSPTPAADGLTFYMESNRSGQYRLYVASRRALGDEFDPPELLQKSRGADESYSDGGIYLSRDGNRLALHARAAGSASSALYAAERRGANFSEPMLLRNVNSAADALDPVLSADELTLYFASVRPDAGAKGYWDIWRATRPSVADDFSSPINVEELNTAGNGLNSNLGGELPSWLSQDNCRLYFDRYENSGLWLYVAERRR